MSAPPQQQSHTSERVLAQCHGKEIEDLDGDLWELFESTAATYSHHEAVVSLWQPGSSPIGENGSITKTSLRWSYEDLLRKSESLAAYLKSKGCKSGDRLVLFLWNSAEWAWFFWASVKLGMVFVPLHPRLSAQDTRHLLELIQPTVLVAADTEVETMLESAAQPVLDKARLRLSCSSVLSSIWTQVSSLSDPRSVHFSHSIQSSSPSDSREVETHPARGDEATLIITTSGTTSTPKCCVHTTTNLLSQSFRFDVTSKGHFERWLVHTPVSHIFAVNHALRAWRNGDTVVFPSKSFEPKQTIRALVEEKCTRMSAVPALIKSLLASEDFPGKESLSLSYVAMGSMMIYEADIQMARRSLGSKDAIQAFGMSEGAPITSWIRNDPLLKNGFRPGVGIALPGCRMRICAPGSRTILNRNEVGELHIGGSSVIKGYLGGVDSDKFYEDDAGHWFMTGDQALIDNDGILHINGRYKELIIRGGENIVPAKLESALDALPGVTAQVIGMPDEIAGQVPVAIVSKPDTVSKEEIASEARKLGSIYRLDGVYTLDEIGFKALPRTPTGKVRKTELKDALLQFQAKASKAKSQDSNVLKETLPNDTNGSRNISGASSQPDLVQILCSIWEELAGIRPDPHSDIGDMADSITALRYCHKVLMELGCRLYLQDLATSPTIAGQAAIINARGFTAKSRSADFMESQSGITASARNMAYPLVKHTSDINTTATNFANSGPSFSYDMMQTQGSRRAILQVLQHLNLDMDDVEDLYPIKDSFHRFVLGARPQSYRHRFSFEIHPRSRDRARQALETALSSSGILRALLALTTDGMPFHVIAKPSKKLFERVIKEISVADNDACQRILNDDKPAAFDPVLMTEATMINMESTGQVVLAITHNHSVFDIFSLNLFHSNLDQLLTNETGDIPGVGSPTPFKLFADLLYLYQDSNPAKKSVEATVGRLRGISKFRSAFWPPQQVSNQPGSLSRKHLESSTNSAAADEVVPKERSKGSIDTSYRSSRMGRIVTLPDMDRLRTEHGIKPAIVAKAALAVFNVLQTGEKYAVFSSADAARTWPFVPPWMEQILPPAMGVDGPAMEWELNMCHVDLRGSRHRPNKSARQEIETVGQLLARLSNEQENLSKYSHAPWFKVLDGLGPEEASAAVDASRRQTFVWDVTLQSSGKLPQLGKKPLGTYQSLKQIARSDWADSGFYWRCCMLDKDHLIFETAWDSAQLDDVDVEEYCNDYSNVLRKLADIKNWDKSAGDVLTMT